MIIHGDRSFFTHIEFAVADKQILWHVKKKKNMLYGYWQLPWDQNTHKFQVQIVTVCSDNHFRKKLKNRSINLPFTCLGADNVLNCWVQR